MPSLTDLLRVSWIKDCGFIACFVRQGDRIAACCPSTARGLHATIRLIGQRKEYQERFVTMRVAIGANHSGYLVRAMLIEMIGGLGHEVVDRGVSNSHPVDYPEIAAGVADLVATGQVDRGILVGGTGLGMCIAANKVAGVRAVPCHDLMTAQVSRLHNDSNVLCLSASLLGDQLMRSITQTWLKTPFEGGRHQNRLDKIAELERQR